MADLTKANNFWKKYRGYSDDSEDFIVGFHELDYRRTNNPIYVWKAIKRMNDIEMTNYPKWIRDYLVISATKLEVCKPVPQGKGGVLAAIGFKSCLQLYEEDTVKIDHAYDLMCGRIRSGMTIEEAALKVEYMIDQDGLKENQRGYLGSSRLEKLYRELRKKRGEGWAIEDVFEEEIDFDGYHEED